MCSGLFRVVLAFGRTDWHRLELCYVFLRYVLVNADQVLNEIDVAPPTFSALLPTLVCHESFEDDVQLNSLSDAKRFQHLIFDVVEPDNGRQVIEQLDRSKVGLCGPLHTSLGGNDSPD